MLRQFHHPAAYDARTLPDSYWAASAGELPVCKTLSDTGTISVDTAVIGAGYAGLSTALELASNGMDVAVFDAGRSGWGASGRNGGFCCLGGSAQSYDALSRQFGTDQARHFAQLQRRAIDLVDARIRDWHIDVDRHSDGEVVLAHKPNRMAELRHEGDMLARFAGVESELLSAGALRERGLAAHDIHGGLYVKAGFGLHPMKYLAGLHRRCEQQGVQIFEQARIDRLVDAGDHYVLWRGDHRITARHVVIATNGYSAENLPDWIGGRLMPVFSGVLVTRPIDDATLQAQGWTSDLMAYDSRILLHYFRKLPDNRFMFGGRGGLNATARAHAAGKSDLVENFHRMFPAWRDVELSHHWTGLVCLSQSFRPYVGPVPGHRAIWTALGWHGNGVALASLGGEMLARQITGQDNAAAIGAVMGTPPARFPFARFRRLGRAIAYRYYGLRDRFA